MAPTLRSRRALKVAVFVACLLPLAWLAWAAPTGGLGANPIEATTRHLGTWAITLLLAALAVSPLRRLTGWSAIAGVRRMVGLFAFFYAALHVMSYVGLDQFFAWNIIAADIVKRRYITAGMAAFVLLAVLAATSPHRVARAMGGRLWRRVHLLVHPAAGLAVLHHFWMVRADTTQPTIHAVVLVILLLERAWTSRRRRAVAPRA